VVQIFYSFAAFAVVPGLLGLFHWLSRVPRPPAQEVEGTPAEGVRPVTLAEEAERWLHSQV
jgi:hypothetical protein